MDGENTAICTRRRSWGMPGTARSLQDAVCTCKGWRSICVAMTGETGWHIPKWISAMDITGKVQAGRSPLQLNAPKGLHKRTTHGHSCTPISEAWPSEEVQMPEHS